MSSIRLEISKTILSKEDYVRTVAIIQKLTDMNRIREAENKCLEYLDNVARVLLEKMDEELGDREVKIGDTTYKLFTAEDVLRNYFGRDEYRDYIFRDYDLTSIKTQKGVNTNANL